MTWSRPRCCSDTFRTRGNAKVARSGVNALAETINGLYKSEFIYNVHEGPWRTVEDIELATLAAWDPRTAHVLADVYAVDRTPARPLVPSLVLTADPSSLVSPGMKDELTRRGFEVRTVRGAGHTLHRDDFDGFLAALDGWI